MTTLDLLASVGLVRDYATPDGPLTFDMMVIAYDAFAVLRGHSNGLTSLQLFGILQLEDPRHANCRWRPGTDRRVNEILKRFKKKGLVEYHKFPTGWKWRLKEERSADVVMDLHPKGHGRVEVTLDDEVVARPRDRIVETVEAGTMTCSGCLEERARDSFFCPDGIDGNDVIGGYFPLDAPGRRPGRCFVCGWPVAADKECEVSYDPRADGMWAAAKTTTPSRAPFDDDGLVRIRCRYAPQNLATMGHSPEDIVVIWTLLDMLEEQRGWK